MAKDGKNMQSIAEKTPVSGRLSLADRRFVSSTEDKIV